MGSNPTWIWQRAEWSCFKYDAQMIALDLAEAYRTYGVLEGKAMAIGVDRTSQIALDALSLR